MNQELLLQTIEIIATHLLHKPDFCGSTEGRRLTELLWQLTGKPSSKPVSAAPPQVDLVTRTISLPVHLDNALSAAVHETGIPRDVLIGDALTMKISQK